MKRSAIILCAALPTLLGCGTPTLDASRAKPNPSEDGIRTASSVQPSVTWTKVGNPGSAAKIAACGESDGRVYAMNDDRTLYVSRANGADSTWSYVTTAGSAVQIFCAGAQLYALNADRSLWRNDGNDSSVRWTRVGTPGSAQQVTGATAFALFVPYSPLYALNDDNTLWRSVSGRDDDWSYVGSLSIPSRIAAGGGLWEDRLFVINSDGKLWLNSGEGCNQYYHQVLDPGVWQAFGINLVLAPLPLNNAEIAAASISTIYVLLPNHTLWKGTINNAEALTSVRADGKPQHCDGTVLVTDHCGDYDENCCAGSCNGAPGMSLVCDGASNLCASCGGANERPCAGNSCDTGYIVGTLNSTGQVLCVKAGLNMSPCDNGRCGGSLICCPNLGWREGQCISGNSCGGGGTGGGETSCPAKNSDYTACCNGQCIGNRFCNSSNQCQPNFGGKGGGGNNGGCAVIVRVHGTTCTNAADGSISNLSHTLCADGCGADQAAAQQKAIASLASQTCVGDAWGCCQYEVDQNFNACGQ